jgi:nitrite reductase/ring-hydroxylating ferredoxin subunit
MKRLCGLDEIADGEARGFDFGRGAEPREVFLVRDGGRVHGYVNSCPHLGTPLEFNPDGFLTADGSAILCSTHGALFRIEDGYCFAGPCAGSSLTALSLVVDPTGTVLLEPSGTSRR